MPHLQAFTSALFRLSFVLCLNSPFHLYSQGVPCNGEESNGDFTLGVELVAENIGPVVDFNGATTDLSGYNTYRVYLNTEGPLDKLSAVYGDDDRPLSIASTQSFYQSPLFPGVSNVLVNANNPLLFSSFPDLIHDSWLTIGIDEAPNSLENETTISLLEDQIAPFSSTFAAGGNIDINTANGGAWYIDNVDLYTNGNAGPNQKVLIAQLTTQGEISGDLAMQVFRDGESTSENCIRPYLSFQSHGCMDDSACNYAPAAIIDNGTCDFCSCPDSLQILSASFPSDSVPSYSLEVELIADHDTTGITTNVLGTPNPLEGMKTYRLYAKVDNPNTRVLSGYGDATEQLNISSTTSFYHSFFGAATPSNISSILFDIPTYAELEFDSWVTIGIDQSPSFFSPEYGTISTIQDPAFTWFEDFESGNALIANTVTGLAWLVTQPTSANVFPDEDLRVLIGQFTTSGTITGTLGLQIIPFDGDAGEDYRLPFSFTTEGLGDYVDVLPDICTCENVDGDYLCDFEDPCIGTAEDCENAFGCTDSDAWNFNPAANEDDGSCMPNACGIDGTLVVANAFDFTPQHITIPIGGTVVWQNQSTYWKNVNGVASSISGLSFNNPMDFSLPNAAGNPDGYCIGSVTFPAPGIYHYDCSIGNLAELGMVGSITVGTYGCLDSTAANFDPNADFDFIFCEYVGCTNPLACNYASIANIDDGSCDVPDDPCEFCDGTVVISTDYDEDGVCADDEVFGCTDASSCTYSPEATEEDGSCLYLDAIGTCGGDCVLDLDSNGVCDTDDAAHCGPGTHWDYGQGLCVITCPSDINLDGAVAIGDLLTLLSDFANFCEGLD